MCVYVRGGGVVIKTIVNGESEMPLKSWASLCYLNWSWLIMTFSFNRVSVIS